VRLLELRIDALPGVEEPFTLSAFAPGVNLLLGPNASGKSRVAHALRCLVDPEASRGAPIHVRGRFEQDGTRWTAERVGDRCTWREDGVVVEAPPLPDPNVLDAWFLRLEDLTEAGGSDAEIARSLATELAGGVDLPGVRDRLVTVGPQRFAPLRRALDDAREARRRAERDASQLAHEHERLHEREERLDRALARAARRPALDAALAALDAQERRRAVAVRLATFPAGMGRLHAGASADAERWVRDVERATRVLAEARAEVRLAERALAGSGLPPDRPGPDDLDELRVRAQELAQADTAVDEARQRSAETAAFARSLAASAGDAPGTAGTAADLDALPPPPDFATLDQLDVLQEALDDAERVLADAERTLDAQRPEDDPRALEHEAARARDDARTLAGWLAAPSARRRRVALLRPVAWSSAAIAALLAVVRSGGLPPLAGEGLAWATTAGVLLVVALVCEAWTRPGRARPAHQAALEGREAPEAWTEPQVERALQDRLRAVGQLERRRDAAVRAEAGRAEALARRTQAQQRCEQARGALHARARSAGLDPERTGRGALERARQARRSRDAAATHAQAAAGLAEALRWQERARARADAARAAVASSVPDGAPSTGASARELARWADTLERRVRRRDHALQQAEVAQRSVEQAQARLDDALRTRDEGLAALLAEPPEAVASDPEAMQRRLHDRLEMREAWSEARRELDRLEDRIDGARDAFADDPEIAGWVAAGDRLALASAREASARAASEVDDHREELARHDERVRAARRSRQLDAARRTERRARDALERAYDDALSSEAHAWALDRIEATFRAERRPARLAAAAAWFARFTHHAYALDLSPAQPEPALEIVERATGTVLSPAQASSGTRAQALLALRIAHAAAAESDGIRLPFVLDEALTTSDADRFAAVAEALADIAREQDRQILYLSARRDDAALWTRLAADTQGRVPAPTVLDLPALRGAERRWDPHAVRSDGPTPTPPLPSAGQDPAAYAAILGVPAVDPWRLAATHPFHLLRDRLDLVHRLARLHVEDLGSLEAVLADAALREPLLGPDAGLLDVRARAAHAWAEAWRTGRGRPVDLTVLADSGAVSDTFLERVAALANELGGDGDALIAALEARRVANFRTEARRDLAAYLGEHGYRSDDEPSSPAARARACEAALAQDAATGAVDGATLARWLEEGRARVGPA
jgi:DNA repair exonuclease SbcCD ATPase subunit